MTRLGAACRAAWARARAGFTSLEGSPRDLYLVFALKVLESYNYFSLSRLFTLYLSEEFGVGDLRAGALYGLWGTLLTAYGFLLGGLIDMAGVKLSLVACFVLNISSRLVMATTHTTWVLLAMLLGPNAVAGALGVPVMTIAVKRYTTAGNRGFAFSLFYSLMNVAALTQGMLMDFFRLRLKHGFGLDGLAPDGLLNNGNRLFLVSGCVMSLAGLLLTLRLSPERKAGARRAPKPAPWREEGPASPEAPLVGSGSRPPSAGEGSAHGSLGSAGSMEVLVLAPPAEPSRWAATLSATRLVLASKGFWKFLAVCIFTVNLKSIFRHLDATLPKYQLRAFGCDTPIGLIYSINPFMIVVFVPIVGALTTGFQHFDMIHYGGYLSALSPFWMVVSQAEWATALFVVTLSLGEAVWSPRWYDYSMSVAPNGREGIFTALTSAPLFAAMLPTGMLSGYLLQTYCPGGGDCGGPVAPGAPGAACEGQEMWGIVGAITLSSPLLILATQYWLRPRPDDFAALERAEWAAGRRRSLGAEYDVNEADPLGVAESICQAAAERP